MYAVARAQLTFQMLTLLKKYLYLCSCVQKHGTANVWPLLLKWLEHSHESEGWGFESTSGRDILCLKNFDTFTRTSVRVSKINAVARAQLTFQMFTLLKKYLYHKSMCSKTWDSKCLALIAQMVRAFAWIRRLGVRVPLKLRHFLSQKLWHFHKNIRSCVENECWCPRTVYISNVNFTSKNIDDGVCLIMCSARKCLWWKSLQFIRKIL